ncbi:hypothetical protein [Massilia sp. TWP1-3-3]|uniref:hypothetical protein n=1 Tax=Massilia sp. TWP1-3-3 TaxID=2804573 RepID=UPI003CEBD37C
MPKNKRPVPRKSATSPGEDDDVQAQALADMALLLAEREHADEEEDAAALHLKEDEFAKLLRNALRKKNDEVLYGAVERARDADVGAYQYLRSRIEEASATLLLHKEGAPAMEINAFAVPLFVHSTGGLKEGEGFQDGDAFDALVASFKQAGLESPDARVVMISHAYDADEADRITYSHLNEMARDAAASMTEKKLVARPALERSMSGWSPTSFGDGDKAVELRFLLGFALKRADDPFYQAPDEEAAADAFFDARMARYRAWTEQAAPLVRRVLAADPDSLAVHFLYQDLFFGAREQGMDELAMLRMMAELGAALAQQAGPARAIVGPADVDDAMVLRVCLIGEGGVLLATSDKALDLAADLQDEVDDVCDALGTLGVQEVSVAMKFDKDGKARDERAYVGGSAEGTVDSN